jgi:DNA-binding NtrC family response regulator
MNKMVLCVAAVSAPLSSEIDCALQGWDVCTAVGLGDAGRQLRNRSFKVGLLVLDTLEPDLRALDAFLRQHCALRWVVICHAELLEQAAYRQLLHEHCFDFHTWPLDSARLSHTLGHAYGVASLGGSAPAPELGENRMSLIGNSRCINRLRHRIARVAPVNAPVLIWGETGTGKELVAHAVHAHSSRSNRPFVVINCAGLAPTLVQSELFGYERGAFTGATREKCGLIESADGGTVFLDEIGDLPMDMQAMMLRFLQEGTINRVGATRPRAVDTRVIAASHVNLEQAVMRGMFREDLYYRLNVLTLEVPALRDRKEDLPLLAQHFFDAYAAERAPQLRGYSRGALEAMQAHDWPGNVRELVNRVRRALVMADGRQIQEADLDLLASPAAPVPAADPEPLRGMRMRTERGAIEAALKEGKSVTMIARELGVSRMTLYRLMAKHGIDNKADRDRASGLFA